MPDGITRSQTAYNNRKGVAKFKTSGDREAHTWTVTSIVKSGYDFDAADSVLSNTIT